MQILGSREGGSVLKSVSTMNKLERPSKADLVWVINRMTALGQDHYLKIALNDLWYKNEKQRIAKAESFSHLAAEKRKAYIDLLAPYDGMRLVDIPLDVLEQADSLMKQAQQADKAYCKLMEIEV